MCVSIWLQAKHFVDKAAGITTESMQEIPDLQPINPRLTKGGKAVCRCRGYYVNTPEGWADHKEKEKHKRMLAEEAGCAVIAEGGQAAFLLAADMPYMQKSCNEMLQTICDKIQASQAVGKKFASKGITDSDLSWLKFYPDRLMLSEFGLQAGQAQTLREVSGNSVTSRLQPRLLNFTHTPPTCPRPHESAAQ
jgi:hypothetical protein